MPKQTTNQLIDTITEVLQAFPWAEHFQEVGDMELPPEHTRTDFEELAREIAKAVR